MEPAQGDFRRANRRSASRDQRHATQAIAPLADLASQLRVGDLVFIQVKPKLFRHISIATGSWTNHVGVVIAVDAGEPVIAESAFPFSRPTPLSRFVGRSKGRRVAIARLHDVLDEDQQARVRVAASRRFGIFYDTGFNLHSPRQFCSRFAREVLNEATGIQVGEIESFAQLLTQRPGVPLTFWKWWYFGKIPWERQTVSPASVFNSGQLRRVFDGSAQIDLRH